MKSKGKEVTFLSSEEEEGEGVACKDSMVVTTAQTAEVPV